MRTKLFLLQVKFFEVFSEGVLESVIAKYALCLTELSGNMNEILLKVGSIFAGIICVVLFILLGWWIVWICFLSRFKFVRELLGTPSPSESEMDLTNTHIQTGQRRAGRERPSARSRIRRD